MLKLISNKLCGNTLFNHVMLFVYDFFAIRICNDLFFVQFHHDDFIMDDNFSMFSNKLF